MGGVRVPARVVVVLVLVVVALVRVLVGVVWVVVLPVLAAAGVVQVLVLPLSAAGALERAALAVVVPVFALAAGAAMARRWRCAIWR